MRPKAEDGGFSEPISPINSNKRARPEAETGWLHAGVFPKLSYKLTIYLIFLF